MTNPFERHIKLRSEQPDPPPNPYQVLYGLRENPFPAMALFRPAEDDPRVNGEIYDAEFRAEEERQFFDLFVKRHTSDEPVPIGFVRLDPQAGGRGNGKSTFLHQMMVRLNTQHWPTEPPAADDLSRAVLALHLLPSPREQNSFPQLLRLIFETLCGDRLRHGGARLVQLVDREIRAALLVALLDEEALADLARRPGLEDTLLSGDHFSELLQDAGIDAATWRRAASDRLERIAPTCGDNLWVQDLLERGVSVERTWRAWCTQGRASSDPQWRRFGASWFADGLVPVLLLAGYRRLYVLLDEFEKIYVYQTSRQREEFLDLFRQVFYERDSVAVRRKFVVSVLSIHPSIETYLRAYWSRVGLDGIAPLSPDEIGRIAVTLGPATPQRMEHLLVTYIDHYRAKRADPCRGTPHPFAREALAEIMERGRYYPRNTLRYAHLILQRAAAQSTSAPIDRAFVQQFFSAAELDDDEDELLPVQLPLRARRSQE